MDAQDAVAAPRIDLSTPELLTDSRLSPTVIEELKRRGHPVRVVEESSDAANFSRPVAILIDPSSSALHSGIDPFHGAIAGGY